MGEVLVLAHPEAIARHVHAAAKPRLVGVEAAQLRALPRSEQRWRLRVPALPEALLERAPVEGRHPRVHFGHAGQVHLERACRARAGRLGASHLEDDRSIRTERSIPSQRTVDSPARCRAPLTLAAAAAYSPHDVRLACDGLEVK